MVAPHRHGVSLSVTDTVYTDMASFIDIVHKVLLTDMKSLTDIFLSLIDKVFLTLCPS